MVSGNVLRYVYMHYLHSHCNLPQLGQYDPTDLAVCGFFRGSSETDEDEAEVCSLVPVLICSLVTIRFKLVSNRSTTFQNTTAPEVMSSYFMVRVFEIM